MSENVESSALIEELIKGIRRTSALRQLVPMEAISGWPIVSKKNGRVYVTIPYYGARSEGKGKTTLYPPIAIITVDWTTKSIVEYMNTRYKNPWAEGNWTDAVGSFPHEEIAKMSVRSYKEHKKELLMLYDVIISCLTEGKNLDEKSYKRFSEILQMLIEPSLIPFYRSINPRFFEYFLKGKYVSK